MSIRQRSSRQWWSILYIYAYVCQKWFTPFRQTIASNEHEEETVKLQVNTIVDEIFQCAYTPFGYFHKLKVNKSMYTE